ncbi:MAG: DNA-3-methyladenine glycosylase [Oscillospiraceae bacterium]|nr:DNA-3-methyladenine glycosylase [Oscillospiraceae bacterium]
MSLSRDFFHEPTTTVAQALLGCRLVRREADGSTTAGIIVETEAYCGYRDPACHSYKGKSERTKAMFGPRGHAYIYLIYGMYYCFNIVSGPPGEPEAVLIRALEPVDGLDQMHARRKTDKRKNLLSGPGKLCMAMDICKNLYGTDLIGDTDLYLEPAATTPEITASKRINIGYAGEAADYLWRFSVTGNPFVSVKP